MQQIIFTSAPARELDAMVEALAPASTFLLVDSNTRALLSSEVLAASKALAGAQVICIPAGDDHKNTDSLALIWRSLVEGGASRKSLLINIGGGMVTDIGGFAAATFKRGIRFINIPTTLLGAVDAAVGGKTGINFCGLKNEIGAFREADAVIISTLLLHTLPEAELMSGYAEMMKHSLLSDDDAAARILARSPLELTPDEMLLLLRESVEVKRRVVAEDPHEKGLRKALNLGHTPAHAFESFAFTRGCPMAHGHAVAWGLVVDLILSRIILDFPSATLHQVAAFVKENYPAPAFTCNDYDELIAYMRHDKKNADASAINFTLLRRPGDIAIDQTVPPETIAAALDIFRDLLQ